MYMYSTVCIWLLGILLRWVILLPYTFLPLLLCHCKSVHEDEWLRAASLQEAEGCDLHARMWSTHTCHTLTESQKSFSIGSVAWLDVPYADSELLIIAYISRFIHHDGEEMSVVTSAIMVPHSICCHIVNDLIPNDLVGIECIVMMINSSKMLS